MRAANQFTIPVSMGMEKRTNPFLRADKPELAEVWALSRTSTPRSSSPRSAPPRTIFTRPGRFQGPPATLKD